MNYKLIFPKIFNFKGSRDFFGRKSLIMFLSLFLWGVHCCSTDYSLSKEIYLSFLPNIAICTPGSRWKKDLWSKGKAFHCSETHTCQQGFSGLGAAQPLLYIQQRPRRYCCSFIHYLPLPQRTSATSIMATNIIVITSEPPTSLSYNRRQSPKPTLVFWIPRSLC